MHFPELRIAYNLVTCFSVNMVCYEVTRGFHGQCTYEKLPRITLPETKIEHILWLNEFWDLNCN